MTEHRSPRVNSARLANFVGQTVRITCKVRKFMNHQATVECSDGGEVTINMSPAADISDPFIEVIGKVLDSTTIQMMAAINLGNDFDMKIVDFVIEKWHSQQFSSVF
ncbi:replication factor A protein 3 [Abortiporus biennis]|nr:replication factor A protein 3 [Abortiporus biennis]